MRRHRVIYVDLTPIDKQNNGMDLKNIATFDEVVSPASHCQIS